MLFRANWSYRNYCHSKTPFFKSICGLSIFLLLLAGCKPKALSPQEFIQQLKSDQAYSKEQQVGAYYIHTRYIPAEFMALMELSKGNPDYNYNKEAFEQEIKSFSNGVYVEATFGLKDGSNIILKGVDDQTAYAARIGSMIYKLTDDFYISASGGEKIKPLSCTFSNTYGNSPEAKVIFVFPKTILGKSKDKIQFVYDDRCFGIDKQVIFEYETGDLTKPLPVILND